MGSLDKLDLAAAGSQRLGFSRCGNSLFWRVKLPCYSPVAAPVIERGFRDAADKNVAKR